MSDTRCNIHRGTTNKFGMSQGAIHSGSKQGRGSKQGENKVGGLNKVKMLAMCSRNFVYRRCGKKQEWNFVVISKV